MVGFIGSERDYKVLLRLTEKKERASDMMVSTKGRYALTVMVDLAKLSDGGYVSLADIAEREHLSMKYLESIISILNKGGMLKSLRGKNGGYMLSRDPSQYNISEILLLTEGTLAGLDYVIDQYLSAITLEDIITGNRKKMLGEYCDHCETDK